MIVLLFIGCHRVRQYLLFRVRKIANPFSQERRNQSHHADEHGVGVCTYHTLPEAVTCAVSGARAIARTNA